MSSIGNSDDSKYKQLFNLVSDAIYVANHLGNIIEVNDAACNMLGRTKDEFTNLKVSDIDSNITEHLFNDYWKNIPANEVQFIHSQHLHKNGNLIDVEISTQKIHVDNEVIFIGIARDITTRNLAVANFKNSEIKFKALFEASPDLVAVVDINGTILDINKVEPSYKKSDVVGTNITEYLSDNDRKDYFDAVHKVLETNETHSYYPTIITPNGNTTYWHNRISLYESFDGVKSFIINFINITDRKKSEIDCKENEKKLLAIIENSTSLYYTHGTDHRLTYLSPQSNEILGYTPDEAMIKWTEMASDHPINEEGFKRTMRAIQTGERQPMYELELVRKDGRKIWVEVTETPVLENGKVVAISGSLRDITDRKTALEELKERTLFLDRILESSALSTWISDENGYAIRTNPACLKFFGATEEEVLGKYCLFKDSVLEQSGLMQEVRDVFEKGKVANILIDYNFAQVDHISVEHGTHKIINSIITPVFDSSGKVINAIIQAIDLTEIKRYEKELIIAKEKAEESDRLKSSFLANMSHEIRTPLNSILGFSELLKLGGLSAEDTNKYLELIFKSGERMLDTVNDVIDISKIETGMVEVNNSVFNIQEQLNNQLELFIDEAETKKLKISRQLPGTDDFIKTDLIKFNSILTNLVKNAIKYTESGEIIFGYNRLHNNYEFFVSDTGVGIPKEAHEAIFNRFEQGENATKKAIQGSGLGLAISKAYVEMLGGKIWVESQLGKGATFKFQLPIL